MLATNLQYRPVTGMHSLQGVVVSSSATYAHLSSISCAPHSGKHYKQRMSPNEEFSRFILKFSGKYYRGWRRCRRCSAVKDSSGRARLAQHPPPGTNARRQHTQNSPPAFSLYYSSQALPDTEIRGSRGSGSLHFA